MLIVVCNSNSDLQPAYKLHPPVMKGVTAKQQAYTKTQWNTSQVKSFLLISLKETTVANNSRQ